MGATTWLSEKMGWDVQQPKENRMFPSHVNNQQGGPLGAANDARGIVTTANSAQVGISGLMANAGMLEKGGGFLGPVAGPIMSGIGGVMNLAGAYGREDGWKNNGIMGASAGANMQGLGGGLGVLASGAGLAATFGSGALAAGGAVAAPYLAAGAAAIGLGARGDSFLKDNNMESLAISNIWDSVRGNDDGQGWIGDSADYGRDLFGGGDGVMGTIGAGLGGTVGAIGSGLALGAGAVGNVVAGGIGLAGDAISLLTSW